MKKITTHLLKILHDLTLTLKSVSKKLSEFSQKTFLGFVSFFKMIQHIIFTLLTISSAFFFLSKNKVLLLLSSLKDFIAALINSSFEKILIIKTSVSTKMFSLFGRLFNIIQLLSHLMTKAAKQISLVILLVKNKNLNFFSSLKNQSSRLALCISKMAKNIFESAQNTAIKLSVSLFSVISWLSNLRYAFSHLIFQIKNALTSLTNIILNAAGLFNSQISQLFYKSKNTASAAKNIAKTALSGSAGYLFISTKNIASFGLDLPKQLFRIIGSLLSTCCLSAKNIFFSFIKSITSTFSEIALLISRILFSIKSGFLQLFSGILSLIENAKSETKNISSKIKQVFYSIGSNTTTRINTAFSEIKIMISRVISHISVTAVNTKNKTFKALSFCTLFLWISIKNSGLKALSLQSRLTNSMMLFFKSCSDEIRNLFSRIKKSITSFFFNTYLLIANTLITIKTASSNLFSAILSIIFNAMQNTTKAIRFLQEGSVKGLSKIYHASLDAFLRTTTIIINAFSAITNSAQSAVTTAKNKTTQVVRSAHEKTHTSIIIGRNKIFAVYSALQTGLLQSFTTIFITAPQQFFRLVQSFGSATIHFVGVAVKSIFEHFSKTKAKLLHGIELRILHATTELRSLKSIITYSASFVAQKISSTSLFLATALVNIFVTQPIKFVTITASISINLTKRVSAAIISGGISLLTNIIGLSTLFFTQTRSAAQKTYTKTSSFISPKATLAHNLSKQALYGAAGFVLFKIPYSVFIFSRKVALLLQQLTTACAIILARIITRISSMHALLQNTFIQIITLVATPIRAIINFITIISARTAITVNNAFALSAAYIISLPEKTYELLLASRLSIQKYSLLGTAIYLALTIFTTYHTNIVHPIFDEEVKHAGVHPHAIAVDTGFELQSLKPTKTEDHSDYGNVAVEGILSYSYYAGTESAADMDAISIKNASPYTIIKKLDSHINQNKIVKTRMYVKTILSTMPSKSPRFPFAPVKSTMTLQNNNLSSKDIYYKGSYTSLALNNQVSGLAQIHLEASSTHAIGYGERRSVPEINITFEHKGIATYTILILYTIILGLTLMSVASLMISTSKLSIILNASSILGIGIIWLMALIQNLIPIMNHLLLTLLICFSIGLLSFSLNLSNQSKNNDTADFKGQTRWIITLLSMLSLFLTLLISF